MKLYTTDEARTLVTQAKKLHIDLYDTTTISEVEALIKHKLLNQFATPLE